MLDMACTFRLADDSSVRRPIGAFELLRPWALWLGRRDARLLHWYMGGETIEEATRHQAFVEDDLDGHSACVALTQTEQKQNKDGAFAIVVWNGYEKPNDGSRLTLNVWHKRTPSEAVVNLGDPRGASRLGGHKDTAELLAMMVRDTKALFGFVHKESSYGHMKIFKDRPGVGWMLYLPRVLTVQQVPEARALVPVMDGKTQLGTIVVSVTDAVFDDKNKEHVAVSHAIETRLVDQDLLPRYADM